MRMAPLWLAAGLAATGAGANAAPPPGYRLVWSDNFRQDPGSLPDAARWGHDLGAGGWGNAEKETYTDSTENARIVSDPFAGDSRALEIVAREDGNGGYTSARILTKGKYAVRMGYIEARIKLPHGQGIWPAFWMLGADIPTVGWPKCGEIDIMENIGREPNRVHGTLHGPGYSGDKGITAGYDAPDGRPFYSRYHLFAVDWRKDSISFLVDGHAYRTITPSDLPKDAAWVFDKPCFMLLNMAVGGRWPGYPDTTTTFPQSMRVDYVRVYQAAE